MTDAEDLLLEIANSIEKDFVDPVAQLDWILDAAKDYFVKRSDTGRPVPAHGSGP